MISEKQLQILSFPKSGYDALICDGSIRSGKTSFMTIGFIRDAMERFNGQRFGICGKTVQAAEKNIITPYMGVRMAQKKYKIKWMRSSKELVVTRGNVTNVFEVFGGKDESSYTLIQGRTLAGVLFDEVALMPESFVDQALARCSVDGSLFWFNCNPESPSHWFYEEWIDQPEKHNALHMHFTMDDNPGLSEAKREQYKTQYSGVFYQRYILGLWVVAEGLIYNFGEKNITDEQPKGAEYYVSVDYGTLNPFAALLWSVTGGKAVAIKEYYYSGRKTKRQKTDEEYMKDMVDFIDGYNVQRFVVDPSASSFITVLRQKGYSVYKAKNDVIDGIRTTAKMLANGDIKIHRSCVNTIREMQMYRWDTKKSDDTVVKEDDHAPDSIRYMCMTVLDGRSASDKWNHV